MKYENVNGSGKRNCQCGSWKQHWINFSSQKWPNQCTVRGCTSNPTLGAHVRRVGEQKEYIVPMCDQCNHRTVSFELDSSVCLVDANTSKTCEK